VNSNLFHLDRDQIVEIPATIVIFAVFVERGRTACSMSERTWRLRKERGGMYTSPTGRCPAGFPGQEGNKQ
jgi:hypothetical protein